MNGPRDHRTKRHKPEKERQIYGIFYMWNLEK